MTQDVNDCLPDANCISNNLQGADQLELAINVFVLPSFTSNTFSSDILLIRMDSEYKISLFCIQ